MQCPSCSTENTDDSKFCMTCGGKLSPPEPTETAEPSSSADAKTTSENPWLEGEGGERAEQTATDAPKSASPPGEVEASADSGTLPPGEVEAPADPGTLPPPPSAESSVDDDERPSPPTPTAPLTPEVAASETTSAALLPPPPPTGTSTGVHADLPLPPPPTQSGAWTAPRPPEGVPPSLIGDTSPAGDNGGDVAAPAPIPMDAGPADPFGLEFQLSRLSPTTRPHAEGPVLIAAALLTTGEHVDVIVPGLLAGEVGVAVVTDRRVLLVNGRRWSPVVVEVPVVGGLVVEGWQDETTAMLTFISSTTVRLSAIVDKTLAFDAAKIVRERVAATVQPSRSPADDFQW